MDFTSSIIGIRHIPDIWREEFNKGLAGTYYTLIASLLFYSLVSLINNKRKGLA